MGITFIPEVYSAEMLESLKKALVFAGPDVVIDTYEGDLRNQGDTVRIRSIGRPAISTYTKGTTVIDPEQLTDAQRALVITESKYFAFEVDDIDSAQSTGGELEGGLTEAVYGLRDVADQFVAGLYTQAQSANQIGTVSVTTPALAYTQIRRLKVVLDEASVPQEGRYVVVPAWYHGLLLEDSRFVDASSYGSTDPIINGEVGRALGFKILMSNNVVNVTGDDWAVMAGVRNAIAYAEQINKVETYRPQNSFSDAVKGLHLYGAKVIRPDAIATVIASET